MKRKSTILLGGLMVLSFSFTAFAENGRNLIQPASVATNSSATPLESKKRGYVGQLFCFPAIIRNG